MRRSAPTVVAGLAAALVLTGCSGGDDSSLPEFSGSSSAAATSSTSGSTPSTSATTDGPLEGSDLVDVGTAPPPGESREVFDAYVEFWQADMAALARSDPQWQPLLDRMSGQQKARTTKLLEENRAKKQRVTGTIAIRPQVLAVRGVAATVRDCLDLSKSVAVDAAGREVAGTRTKEPVAYQVTLAKGPSGWAVSNLSTVDDPTCR